MAERVVGLNALVGELVSAGPKMLAAAITITRTHGFLMQTAAKRSASLPRTAPRGPNTGGPRLITGGLNRSINTRTHTSPTEVAAITGTAHPAARRLEYGFVGLDARGRHANSPPYPFLNPAFDEVEPLYVAAMTAAMGAVWRG